MEKLEWEEISLPPLPLNRCWNVVAPDRPSSHGNCRVHCSVNGCHGMSLVSLLAPVEDGAVASCWRSFTVQAGGPLYPTEAQDEMMPRLEQQFPNLELKTPRIS